MSLLSRSNVSSCSFLPLCVGEAVVYRSFNRTSFERGAVFGGTFLFALHELHETGTIRKHWNRATIYAETKRVHKQLSEIHALECGLKNCVKCNVMCNTETVVCWGEQAYNALEENLQSLFLVFVSDLCLFLHYHLFPHPLRHSVSTNTG